MDPDQSRPVLGRCPRRVGPRYFGVPPNASNNGGDMLHHGVVIPQRCYTLSRRRGPKESRRLFEE